MSIDDDYLDDYEEEYMDDVFDEDTPPTTYDDDELYQDLDYN